MKIFEVSGNDYNMGFSIGENFKPYLLSVIGEFAAQVPEQLDKIKYLERKLALALPNCLDELYGRADGAGIDRNAMLLYMFPEILGRTDGCTTVTVKKQDNILFAHNEDDRGFNADNVALVKYCYEDSFVFAYTMACRMAGSAYAFNSHGLLFSSNYIFGGDLDLDNVSRYIILRDVINAKSVEEVKQKLLRHKAASPFSLNVVDMNALTCYNFEKDLEALYVHEIKDSFARSNHFVLKQGGSSRAPKNSLFRCEKARELTYALDAEACTLEDILGILAYEGSGMDSSVFQDPDKYPDKIVTVSTFGADVQKGEFYAYDFIEKACYVFDKDADLLRKTPIAKAE